MQELVLASSSQRRLDLLKQININPDYIISPEIDETKLKKESNLQYVERMAQEKALKICEDNREKGGFLYKFLFQWSETTLHFVKYI